MLPGSNGVTARMARQGVVKPRVISHPIAMHALSMMRDRGTGARELRHFSNQLLISLTLEATATMPTREFEILTGKGAYAGKTLGKRVVLVSLSKHSIGLSHSVADFIPDLAVGNITIESKDDSQRLEPRLHLANSPALHESRVILFDPIVKAGYAAGIALNLLRKSGAVDLSFICFVTSEPGLQRIQAVAPEVTVITAAIDKEYDSKLGPLPGITNFSERLYA